MFAKHILTSRQARCRGPSLGGDGPAGTVGDAQASQCGTTHATRQARAQPRVQGQGDTDDGPPKIDFMMGERLSGEGSAAAGASSSRYHVAGYHVAGYGARIPCRRIPCGIPCRGIRRQDTMSRDTMSRDTMSRDTAPGYHVAGYHVAGYHVAGFGVRIPCRGMRCALTRRILVPSRQPTQRGAHTLTIFIMSFAIAFSRFSSAFSSALICAAQPDYPHRCCRGRSYARHDCPFP
jgi:hypothetical protein